MTRTAGLRAEKRVSVGDFLLCQHHRGTSTKPVVSPVESPTAPRSHACAARHRTAQLGNDSGTAEGDVGGRRGHRDVTAAGVMPHGTLRRLFSWTENTPKEQRKV